MNRCVRHTEFALSERRSFCFPHAIATAHLNKVATMHPFVSPDLNHGRFGTGRRLRLSGFLSASDHACCQTRNARDRSSGVNQTRPSNVRSRTYYRGGGVLGMPNRPAKSPRACVCPPLCASNKTGPCRVAPDSAGFTIGGRTNGHGVGGVCCAAAPPQPEAGYPPKLPRSPNTIAKARSPPALPP